MTEPLDETPSGAIDFAALDRLFELNADVIAVGPGLAATPAPLRSSTGCSNGPASPLVIDADALNAFASDPDRLMGRDGVDVIVTPHPGEMARLLGISIESLQRDRLEQARQFAATHRVARRAQRASHRHRRPRRAIVRQPDWQRRHGYRRNGRCADRDDRGVGRAAARRRGRVQARRVPARHGGRHGRGGRRGGRPHCLGSRRTARCCRARVDRTTPATASREHGSRTSEEETSRRGSR